MPGPTPDPSFGGPRGPKTPGSAIKSPPRLSRYSKGRATGPTRPRNPSSSDGPGGSGRVSSTGSKNRQNPVDDDLDSYYNRPRTLTDQSTSTKQEHEHLGVWVSSRRIFLGAPVRSRGRRKHLLLR